MKKNSKLIKILAVLVLVLGLGYIAYDNYFKLPVTTPQVDKDKNKKNEEPEFDRFNILVLGLDGRLGVNDRTDTIILVSIDGKTKKAKILSIPRDTRVKIKGAWDKINAAYAYGGLDLTKTTLNDFLGVEIDRYAIVNFNSLIKVVDLIGGIDIDVPIRMYVPLEGIDLQKGMQHLDGKQVLAYSRFRGTNEGDIGRAKRQQQVIKLMLEKVLAAKMLNNIPELYGIVKENVETDLTLREAGALARIASDIMDNGIDALVLPGENKKIDGLWYWEPERDNIQDIMANVCGNKKIAAVKNDSSKHS